MANNPKFVITIKLNCEISLWQAIKLRIAGSNFKPLVESVLKKLADKNG